MMINHIFSFNEIPILQHTLVLCDIDNTVLHYPECNKTCRELMKDMPLSLTKEAYLKNFQQACHTYRMTHDHIHTDYVGFQSMVDKLKQTGGKLLFLTSRNKVSHTYTITQLRQIGVKCDDSDIHYTDNLISKGEYIKTHFPINEWTNTIFIDDFMTNIHSVNTFFPEIKCYLFIAKDAL